MAVKRPLDSLAELLGEARRDRRFDSWLWFHLIAQGAGFNHNNYEAPNMRDEMAAFITSRSIPKEAIHQARSWYLLPKEYLAWISEDERQQNWILPRVMQLTGQNALYTPPKLLGRALLVSIIDYWNIDPRTKATHISSLESCWIEHKKQDRIYRWFKDSESAKRCALAWEWLLENEPMLTEHSREIESYTGLLQFFDHTNFSHADKVLRIEAIKKIWGRQKYRASLVGRKQYNFVLTDKVVSLLDGLAAAHNLKRPQILEILIEMEADNGMYISERLKTTRGI